MSCVISVAVDSGVVDAIVVVVAAVVAAEGGADVSLTSLGIASLVVARLGTSKIMGASLD